MSDLRDRFVLADRLEAPDVWASAVAQAEHVDETRMVPSPRQDIRRRLAAAVVALLVFIGAGVLVWEAFSDRGRPAVDEPQPSIDPWGSLPQGLNEFPPPPSSRTGSAQVWTGSELVLWGGARDDGAVRFDDGFSLDPIERRWTVLPASPLEARYFPAAVWTGGEVVIWGGSDGVNRTRSFSDGAAYDPRTRTWRILSDAPITYDETLAVWTGTEMVIWNPPEGIGAAYDPETDTWRRIADPPFPLERSYTAVWTGVVMIVLGMSSDGPHEEIRARGLSYDVSTDTWAELARPDLAEEAVTIVWTGREVIGVDYNHQVQSYRPGDDAWTDLPKIPLKDGEGWQHAVAYAGGDLFVNTVSGPIVLDVATETWSEVVPPLRPVDAYYLDPISAGSAIVVLQGSTTAFVWKPSPSDGQTSSIGSISPSPLSYASFGVEAQPISVLAADGWIWVGVYDYEQDVAATDKLDPRTGELVTSVPVPGRPEWLASTGGALWASVYSQADGSELVRIDEGTGGISLRMPGFAGPIVAAPEGLWAIEQDRATKSNALVLLDDVSGQVIRRVSLSGTPIDIEAAGGYVWVLSLPRGDSAGSSALLLVTAAGEDGGVAIDVSSTGIWLAADDAGVWLSASLPHRHASSVFVAAGDGEPVGFGEIYNFRPFVVAQGRVWFVGGPHDGPVLGVCGMLLDTQGVDVCADVDVADLTATRQPVAFDATTNTLWVAAYESPRVYRADVTAN